MTANDPLERLRDAGFPVDQFPEAQRQVMSELSPEEIATLIKIQERVAARQGKDEVEGYLAGDVGRYIF